MQIIHAVFAGSLIRAGSAKLSASYRTVKFLKSEYAGTAFPCDSDLANPVEINLFLSFSEKKERVD